MLDGGDGPFVLGPKKIQPLREGDSPSKLNASLGFEEVHVEDQYDDGTMGAAIVTLTVKGTNTGKVHWRLGRPNATSMVALSRFKLWWMMPHHVTEAARVPAETQLLLGETANALPCGGSTYTLFIPLLDGPAKSCLVGASDQTIHLVADTGCSDTPVPRRLQALLVSVGENPFRLLAASMAIIRKYHATPTGVTAAGDWSIGDVDGTTSRSNSPKPPLGVGVTRQPAYPEFVDYLGWCTWDSCYTAVNHSLVLAGLKSLTSAGIRIRWMVLDDGWQTVGVPNAPNGKQWRDRLTALVANDKFKNLGETVKAAKEEYGVEHFLVWHAVHGYWQGVDANKPELQKFKPKWTHLRIPSAIAGVDPEMKLVSRLSNNFVNRFQYLKQKFGFGMVPPECIGAFYTDYHNYLKSQGVDGVKVDAQAVLSCLGHGHGGSVRLTRATHAALSASVHAHFSGPSIIHCMCHDSAMLLQLPEHYPQEGKRPVVRGSDDFYPRDAASQGCHLYANAFNALLLAHCGGLQDWDLFQTSMGIPGASAMHAAARSISGGPIYISDKPGDHDTSLLKKLVLEDGSVPRANTSALPTARCLFTDMQTTRDKPLLSVWSENPAPGHGVVGVFNIYGSKWDQGARAYRHIRGFDRWAGGQSYAVAGGVKPVDCHALADQWRKETAGKAVKTVNGQQPKAPLYAVYLHNSGGLHMVGLNEEVTVGKIGTIQFELASISRVYTAFLSDGREVLWSSIGLPDIFNSGGVVVSEAFTLGETLTTNNIILSNGHGNGSGTHAPAANSPPENREVSVEVVLKGSGLFLALCSIPPAVVACRTASGEPLACVTEYLHPMEGTEVGRLQVTLPSPYTGEHRRVTVSWAAADVKM